MKEFDFDELDRAVNSVLEDVKHQKEASRSESSVDSLPKAERQSPVVSSRERIPSRAVHSRTMTSVRPARTVVSTEVGKVAEQPKSSAIEHDSPREDARSKDAPSESVAPPDRPLARRRSGRFMDVVHPSSDMKTASMGMPSRQGKTILPASEKPAKTPDEPENTAKTPEPETSIDPVLSQKVEDILKEDPLADSVTLPPETPKVEEYKTDLPDDILDGIDTSGDTNPVALPLTSPFLEDAQVEKRPLGSRSKPTEPDNSTPENEEKGSSETEDLNVNTPAEVEKLHEKIEAIESVQLDVNSANPETVTMFSVDDKKTEDSGVDTSLDDKKDEPALSNSDIKTDDSKEDSVGDDSEKTEDSDKEVVASGPSSIARQYKEVPRVASEDDTSPIFDPENYQQSLDTEPKKKSGLGWAIAIIILLLIIAGAVAFLWQSGVLVAPISQ